MRWTQRLHAQLITRGVAFLLVVCAIPYLTFAGYLELRNVVPPAEAALLIAITLVVLALVVLFVLNMVTRYRRHRKRGGRERDSANPIDEMEAALSEHTNPVLGEWIRRHPGSAAAATLALGFTVGCNRSARRTLGELFDLYVDSEQERNH